MTPLIREMVKLSPEPETAMWFDVGQLGFVKAMRVPIDFILNTPFPRTAIAAIGSDGIKLALWLIAGEGTLTVAGFTIEGDKAKYFNPLAIIEAESRLHYYVNGQEIPVDQANSLIRMCVACLLKIESASEAYKPTVPATHINRKRVAKGKQPLFDWHTVTIEPKANKQSCNGGGTHASPRLHDRRSHWRKHPSGKSVWVKACKVGCASNGVVFKDYRVAETHEVPA